MTRSGDIAQGPISKALSADFVSMPKPISACGAAALQVLRWLTQHSRGVLVRGVPRRLRVAETVSLGDKRFVSILQVDGEQFLVGGSQSNIVLLAQLETKPEAKGANSFESVFSRVGSGAGDEAVDSRGSVEATR
jgi:flagellar biogenesis protein FliO